MNWFLIRLIKKKESSAKLGAKAMGRRALENNEGYELRESQPVGSSCPVVARRAKQGAGSDLSGRSLKPKVLTTIYGKLLDKIQEHNLVRQEMSRCFWAVPTGKTVSM
jgi:hypothetical protein